MQSVCKERLIVDRPPPQDNPAFVVAARLRRCPYLALRNIECEPREDGAVVLRGKVANFHLKQLAQELALHVPGVRHVRNYLEVAPIHRRPSEFGQSH